MKRIIGAFLLCLAIILSSCTENTRLSNYPPSTDDYLWMVDDYTGYMDQCTEWEGYWDFQNRDYDGDGLVDKVYRIADKQSFTCTYRIEFGNGKMLEIPNLEWSGIPHIQNGDIDEDGEQELLYTQSHNHDPVAYEMAFYDFDGAEYKELELPIHRSKYGDRTLCLTVGYQIANDETIAVTIQEINYTTEIVVQSEVMWEQYKRGIEFEPEPDDGWVSCPVIHTDGEKSYISCKLELLDKWCPDEIHFDIVYEQGSYVIKNVQHTKIGEW